ncbi:hypothetical protein [Armatimonas sp.]|uniref:hypothetical protein n=1 Tax=Armatimonas sp. TaxID=1872638 RepID=UPI00375333E5
MLLITPPALVLFTPTQEKTILTKIELRYIPPSEAVKQLERKAPLKSLRPPGLENLLASDADNTLIAQGTAEAVEALKVILRSLDVKPLVLELKVQFVQQGENVIYLRLRTRNDQKGTVTLGEGGLATSLVIVPHLSDDGKSVSFEVIREIGDPQSLPTAKKTRFTKAGSLGREVRITLPDGLLFLTATLVEK